MILGIRQAGGDANMKNFALKAKFSDKASPVGMLLASDARAIQYRAVGKNKKKSTSLEGFVKSSNSRSRCYIQ